MLPMCMPRVVFPHLAVYSALNHAWRGSVHSGYPRLVLSSRLCVVGEQMDDVYEMIAVLAFHLIVMPFFKLITFVVDGEDFYTRSHLCHPVYHSSHYCDPYLYGRLHATRISDSWPFIGFLLIMSRRVGWLVG